MTDNGRKPLPLADSVWNVEGKKRPVTVPRTSESEIAELATRLSGLSAVSHVPDGETSSGHQKYRTLTPQEVAERAIAIAEAVFSELEARGHIVFVPPYDEWPNDSGPMGFTPCEKKQRSRLENLFGCTRVVTPGQ
jgi:hypothetical protein